MDTLPQGPFNGSPHWPQPSMLRVAALLVILALVVSALYLGREILLPLALAALLAFLLDPLVSALRRRGVPRGLAVAAVIAGTSGLLGGVALTIGSQIAALGREVPTYQHTIQKKLGELRASLTGRGTLNGASRVIGIVENELDAARRALESAATNKPAREPMRVQVEDRPTSPWKAMGDWLAPILMPVLAAGLVLIFLVFILLERHELRDRVLRLVGGDLHRSNEALDEAALLVSRYLRLQLLYNVGFGVPLALGLWAIGVPGAWLWGAFAALLRFVPYLGPLIAAVFPLTMAFAVDPGWAMVGWTFALILTLELISNNLVEPWLFGRSVGVSAVAVLVSASFWALVWGPAGLVLATPLTVCAVVLGRHLAPLQFLDLLLGSRPVFDVPTRLYHRLIAGDAEEAAEMAIAHAAAQSPQAFIDDVGLPMLRLADSPPEGRPNERQLARLERGTHALLRDLTDEHPLPASDAPASAARVLCIGGRSLLDDLAARMLAQGLAREGFAVEVMPPASISAERIAALELGETQTVCLSYSGSAPPTQVRYVCRRLRRKKPTLRILLVPWSDRASPAEVGADGQAWTVVEAAAWIGSVPSDAAGFARSDGEGRGQGVAQQA